VRAQQSGSPKKKQSSPQKSKKILLNDLQLLTYSDLFPQVEEIKREQKMRLFEIYTQD